jgi:hypothetical protein
MWTDMTKLVVAFRSFVKAPKKKLYKKMVQRWLQLAGLRHGGVNSLGHGNKVPGPARRCEFSDQLNKYLFSNSAWLYEEYFKML